MKIAKRCIQILMFMLCIIVFSAGIVSAASSSDLGIDKSLAAQYQDFTRFAESKIKQMNRHHKYARSRMAITRQADGTYRARYHRINSSTVKAKVKRSNSKAIPYVGILSYREEVLESSALDRNGFEDSLFAVVEIIPNRQIFSYQGGAWK